jgi:hypothetical protein
MVLENVHKSALITKFGLFDQIVMFFDMKNAINTFSKTMKEVFGAYMDKFLKVFVDDLNVHSLNWEEHLKHLQYDFMRLREVNLKSIQVNMNLQSLSWSFLVMKSVEKVHNQIIGK